DEDVAALDDGARLVLVEADLVLAVEERRLPQHVIAVLAAPGERQAPVGRLPRPGRPAPARPVVRPRPAGQASRDDQSAGDGTHRLSRLTPARPAPARTG